MARLQRATGAGARDMVVGVYYIGVDFEYRRQGIGAQLLDYVVEVATECGCGARLRASRSRTRAQLHAPGCAARPGWPAPFMPSMHSLVERHEAAGALRLQSLHLPPPPNVRFL